MTTTTTKKNKKKKDVKVKKHTNSDENSNIISNVSSTAVSDHIKMNAEAANDDNECENTNDESASSVYYSPLTANSSSHSYER